MISKGILSLHLLMRMKSGSRGTGKKKKSLLRKNKIQEKWRLPLQILTPSDRFGVDDALQKNV